MCCLAGSVVLTIAVLVAVVAALVIRPGGVNEGVAAAAGAVAVLIVGTATPLDVWQATRETAGVLTFLLAMMVAAVVAEEAGCFTWAAHRAVRLSRGNGHLLFLNLYLLGALVTVFLSLDVTAIMIAPIVCALVRRMGLPAFPFVAACAYVANTASLFLPVSNLTNMLVYSLLGVPFWTFARLLTLPNLAAMVVNLLVFFALFHRVIPRHIDVPVVEKSVTAGKPASRLILTGTGLGAVVIGLLASGALGLPLFIPAVVGALGLSTLALARQEVSATRLLRGIAWPLPLFVIGMDTVIVAADRVGLTQVWANLLTTSSRPESLGRLLLVAFGTGAGSNLFNNIPMSLAVIVGLPLSPDSSGLPIAFASLIGTNVGPNVTVFGSLATLLVLYAARRQGIIISPSQYLKVGLLTTPLMISAATFVLWLLVR